MTEIGLKARSCKRSETLFKSLLFWLAGELSWLAVEDSLHHKAADMFTNIVSSDLVLLMHGQSDIKICYWSAESSSVLIQTRFHNLQRQALTQFIKLYQYMT